VLRLTTQKKFQLTTPSQSASDVERKRQTSYGDLSILAKCPTWPGCFERVVLMSLGVSAPPFKRRRLGGRDDATTASELGAVDLPQAEHRDERYANSCETTSAPWPTWTYLPPHMAASHGEESSASSRSLSPTRSCSKFGSPTSTSPFLFYNCNKESVKIGGSGESVVHNKVTQEATEQGLKKEICFGAVSSSVVSPCFD
jgi:hypothetical protein